MHDQVIYLSFKKYNARGYLWKEKTQMESISKALDKRDIKLKVVDE